MFIQPEQTPNPATLKFLPGCTVMETGTANFPERGAAARSPLAERLFELPEVTGVFFGTDFITVTKNGDSEWPQLQPAVLAAIMPHVTAGAPAGGRDRAGSSCDRNRRIGVLGGGRARRYGAGGRIPGVAPWPCRIAAADDRAGDGPSRAGALATRRGGGGGRAGRVYRD